MVDIQSERIFNNVMVHTYLGMKHWYTNKPPYTSYTILPLTLTQYRENFIYILLHHDKALIDSNVFLDLLGSTTDSSADGENIYTH